MEEESVGPPGDVEDSWWKDGEVRKKLAQLYLSHELYPQYLDTLVPAIQETLYLESQNHKV